MIYIEAPKRIDVSRDSISVFLAGSITGAFNWQAEVAEKIKDLDIVVYNPRRKNWNDNDKALQEVVQIKWEFESLRKSTFISFWFSYETVAPITLFELGTWSASSTPILIGAHPEYVRRRDIEIQMGLLKPDLHIYDNLDDLSKAIRRQYMAFSGK